MIHIQKDKVPKEIDFRVVKLAREKLEEFYNRDNRNQDRYSFPFKKRVFKLLQNSVYQNFNGKCAYCETKISKRVDNIDHYRPNNGIRSREHYYPDLYWWLTYEWHNLLYVCRECKQYKANYFPVEGNRANASNRNTEIEYPLLINPCEDDPSQHFKLSLKGEFKGLTDKGIQTIELLKLNRNSLISRRSKAMRKVELLVSRLKIEDEISTLDIAEVDNIYNANSNIEFAFTKQQHLLECLENNPSLSKWIENYDGKEKVPIPESEIHRSTTEIVKSDYFPIKYIEIKNFKSINNLKIVFPKNEEDFSWLVFLGENGLGKSSILQAICLCLKPNLSSGDEEISKYIRKGCQKATIQIKEKDSDNIVKTILTRKDNQIEHQGDFYCPLLGYGSVRLLPNKFLVPEDKKNGVKYSNLFVPSTPISDIFGWLQKIFKNDRNLFDTVAYSLKQILPRRYEDDLTIKHGKLHFVKLDQPFSNLSDGYKSTISLALDIMYSLSDGNTDMDKLTGIVLIDELGNQLHPRWQMQVVQQFRKVFPKVNFIVSTHHPLCLRGLKKNEIVVLKKDKEDQLIAIQDLPNPKHLRVDQILSSPYFGLHSAIDPEIEYLFDEYYALLAKDDLSVEDRNRKLELSEKIPQLKFLGNNLREELALYAIDKLLAEKENEEFKIDELKEQAKSRVRQIWESIKEI